MCLDYWHLGLSRPASRVCSPEPEPMTLCCRVAKNMIRAGTAGGETRRVCLFDFLMRLLVSFRPLSRLGAKKGDRKKLEREGWRRGGRTKKTCSRCQREALENNTRNVWSYGLVYQMCRGGGAVAAAA
jgi:hypothetical protein